MEEFGDYFSPSKQQKVENLSDIDHASENIEDDLSEDQDNFSREELAQSASKRTLNAFHGGAKGHRNGDTCSRNTAPTKVIEK